MKLPPGWVQGLGCWVQAPEIGGKGLRIRSSEFRAAVVVRDQGVRFSVEAGG
eukprot:CAMPEP_0184291166 /NCGR_PEP_ID=MMETSP1049-20130417/3244_1 /TAXON_ID=77928 /ORGANISM="Proteomonas sulcata, Strain CCMP704" /LENGTH=51 /DNA_ID=CAMNT_0026598513 /DNA_START=26 /DNA_END=181 /DNA_ORIENTATION=+